MQIIPFFFPLVYKHLKQRWVKGARSEGRLLSTGLEALKAEMG